MGEALGETGRYVDRWVAWATDSRGPLGSSRLTNERRGPVGVTYIVETRPGVCTYELAASHREFVAAALGVGAHRLVFDEAAWLDDASKFQLTIVEKETLATTRFAREPELFGGLILNVGRFADEHGEVVVPMWTADHGRTVPLGLFGPPHSGRSAALRQLAAGAGASRAMNVLLVEPSGFREPELRRSARVALVGEQGARRAWAVLDAIVAARRRFAQSHERAYLGPSETMPGWTVIFADVLTTANESAGGRDGMVSFLRDGDRLGLWTVAVAESLAISAWGSERIRARFAPQMIAFGSAMSSADQLGFTKWCGAVAPDAVVGSAMANFGPRRNVPFRWDLQPGEGDQEVAEGGGEARSAQTLLTRCAVDAPVHPVDAAAITAVLREEPGVDGRWDVGQPS